MPFLKKVKVPDTECQFGYVAAATAPGIWHKWNGEFSAGDITTLTSTYSNKPGYASAGDRKLTKATTSDTTVTGRVGPVSKNIYIPEDSDSSHTTIYQGQMALFFTGGQFETDQFVSVSGTGGAFGDYLKLNDDGKLVEESTATTETAASVARVVRLNNMDSGGASAYDSLVFEMIK